MAAKCTELLLFPIKLRIIWTLGMYRWHHSSNSSHTN